MIIFALISSLVGPSARALVSSYRPPPTPAVRRVLYEGEDFSSADPLAQAIVQLGTKKIGSAEPLVDEFFFCGGFVYAPRVVITAAHCVNKMIQVVRDSEFTTAGAVKFRLPQGDVVRKVREYIRFPGAEQVLLKAAPYDLALVFLDEAVPGVEPATLASLEDLRELSVNPQVLSAGYGFQREYVYNQDTTWLGLKRWLENCANAAVPCAEIKGQLTARESQTKDRWKIRPLRYAFFSASLVEARSLNYRGGFTWLNLVDPSRTTTICQGDSGAPSFLRVHGRWVAIGIHSGSSNVECWDTKLANGVGDEVSLAHFAAWIEKTVSEHERWRQD